MERLYFDYNATAPLASGLRAPLFEWVETDPKNPVSVHQDGQAAGQSVEVARRKIVQLLGGRPKDRLIFTSGGTESNNTILHSAFLNRGARNQLLLSPIEHSCVYNFAKFLESQYGIELSWIKVDRKGEIDLEDYASKLESQKVFLTSMMLANNETGFLFPIQKMAEMAREKDILFHTDAVCAAGKIPISFEELGVDFLSFSSHKFGGLKGTGGILMKEKTKLTPYIYGGTHEFGKRAGTHNVFGILASAYALETWSENLSQEGTREAKLRELLKEKIRKIYPGVVFVESKRNLPQTLSASFAGLSGNLLLTNLDLEGVSASYGSACASGSLEISRVMRNLELPLDEAKAALRFSFGRDTTEEMITDFGERLKRAIEKMFSL